MEKLSMFYCLYIKCTEFELQYGITSQKRAFVIDLLLFRRNAA
jgi:hypothetical protein